jgi:hypothetical protein
MFLIYKRIASYNIALLNNVLNSKIRTLVKNIYKKIIAFCYLIEIISNFYIQLS